MKTKICLVLTASTLKENLSLVQLYRPWIDIVELRVDLLDQEERLHIRSFPELANIPCILTIRRNTDGGKFIEGEGSRIALFARGLAFADTDRRKNFAYVDFEEDLNVPSLEEAARAFGTKIIRSVHNMTGVETNLKDLIIKLRQTHDEIAKIAFMPHSLSDVTRLFNEAKNCTNLEYILIAMGPVGLPSRILSPLLGSAICYTSVPNDKIQNVIGQLDPVVLNEVYHFRSINPKTQVFGITGYPLTATSSPLIHNKGYEKQKLDAVYIPVRADNINEALLFAETINMQGLSVTVPFKETIIEHLDAISPETSEIVACNTIVKNGNGWEGYNTDGKGFARALLEFLQKDSLKGLKISIIGAGGASRAIAHTVYELQGKACLFNRTVDKARDLARKYNFKWASLDSANSGLLETWSDVIIQTTSVGMTPHEQEDPLDFYSFNGHEAVYDVIYHPEKTPLLKRAEKAGCKICNGYTMLLYQAHLQYKLFTNQKYQDF